MAHVRQHGITTEELLVRLELHTIDFYVTHRQLSWAGHLARMDFSRQPRRMLSSWVTTKRPCGAPVLPYGRGLKKALRKANILVDCWFQLAQDRGAWNLTFQLANIAVGFT